MKVLVGTTNIAEDRITLAAVRSLGRRGAHVLVGSDAFWGQAFYSRYSKGRLRYPNPRVDLDLFAETLRDHLEREKPDVLLPGNDYITLAVSQRRELLEPLAPIPIPDNEALEIAHDKAKTFELARSLGLRIPETHQPQSEQELETLAREIDYPCVVKLRSGGGSVGLRYPRDPATLLRAFSERPVADDIVFAGGEPLIQQYIDGEIHDVNCLFSHGEPRALVTHRRIRTFPKSGGRGIYEETTDEPDIREQAVALLKALRWHGPAEVEFLREKGTGTPYLMEINGRFWGSLDLAIHAGVDFPWLACKLAVDGDVPAVTKYSVGVRYRWLIPFGVSSALEEPPWSRDLWRFWFPPRGTFSDVQLDDPLPLFAESAHVLKRGVNRCF